MITTMAHICIHTADLEQNERFYCDVLGLQKKFNFVKDGAVIGYYIQVAERSFIEVFKSDRISTGSEAPIKHFCLEVTDLDAVERRLAQSGVASHGKQRGVDHSWQLWCRDPDGIEIEFHQYTSTSSQTTGIDCTANW